MEPQIVLSGISKSFTVLERKTRPLGRRIKRQVDALKNLSFSMNQGELVGYIGPNGAGKSTTVKIMSGILHPDAGDCTIAGRIPWKQRTAHVGNLGVVFGQRSQLWWDVPVQDSFLLLKEIYGISKGDYQQRLKELSTALDFALLLKTPVRQLSLGQRMRCEIGAALLHRPQILFLDEPTIGLDAVSKLALRGFLKEENRQLGITMILTTHDMGDVEALCTRIMTIGHGQLLFDGDLLTLKDRFAPLHQLKVQLFNPCMLPPMVGVQRIEQVAQQYTLWFDPKCIPAHALLAQLAALSPLGSVTVQEQDVDQIVAGMYKEMAL